MKGKKKKLKFNQTFKHKPNTTVRPRFFYGPFIPIWYCINLLFWYLDAQSAQQPSVSFLHGFHVAFNMYKLLEDIPHIKKATVSR
jgi:hypothetical protein